MTSSGDGSRDETPNRLTAEELVELYPPPPPVGAPVVYWQSDWFREELVRVHSDCAFLPEPATTETDLDMDPEYGVGAFALSDPLSMSWIALLAHIGAMAGVVDRACYRDLRP